MERFGLIGSSGYVGPRHIRAISAVNAELSGAHDVVNDAAGLRDYFPNARFFTNLEDFGHHLSREAGAGRPLDYLSVCSPNHLHDHHIRFGLRNGADVICEKPVVIDPRDLELLRRAEEHSGRRVWTILQLRLLPSLISLRERIMAAPSTTRFSVDLAYVTERGPEYFASWKGDESLSGGIATNIGIHFFDLLLWMFGGVIDLTVEVRRREILAGTFRLARADVRWLLSVDAEHLPASVRASGGRTFRSITVDGAELDFTNYGAGDLHTASYLQVLAGEGFGLDEAAASVEVAHRVRTTPLSPAEANLATLVSGSEL